MTTALFIGGPLDGKRCPVRSSDERITAHPHDAETTTYVRRTFHMGTAPLAVYAHSPLNAKQTLQMLIDGYRQPAEKPYVELDFPTPDPAHGPPPLNPSAKDIAHLQEIVYGIGTVKCSAGDEPLDQEQYENFSNRTGLVHLLNRNPLGHTACCGQPVHKLVRDNFTTSPDERTCCPLPSGTVQAKTGDELTEWPHEEETRNPLLKWPLCPGTVSTDGKWHAAAEEVLQYAKEHGITEIHADPHVQVKDGDKSESGTLCCRINRPGGVSIVPVEDVDRFLIENGWQGCATVSAPIVVPDPPDDFGEYDNLPPLRTQIENSLKSPVQPKPDAPPIQVSHADDCREGVDTSVDTDQPTTVVGCQSWRDREPLL